VARRVRAPALRGGRIGEGGARLVPAGRRHWGADLARARKGLAGWRAGRGQAGGFRGLARLRRAACVRDHVHAGGLAAARPGAQMRVSRGRVAALVFNVVCRATAARCGCSIGVIGRGVENLRDYKKRAVSRGYLERGVNEERTGSSQYWRADPPRANLKKQC
jgi:hypothetical protein